jgi:GNAT superfamily N-acetyltransferase
MLEYTSSHHNESWFQTIADAIAEENRSKSHMIPETPDHLKWESLNHGFLIAHTRKRIAWFIKLSLLDSEYSIYERWSLIVLPEFRGQWIGSKLIHKITQENIHRSIVSITTEERVKIVNRAHHGFQVEIARADTPSKLLKILEWPQALLVGDSIFINMHLYSRIQRWIFDI